MSESESIEARLTRIGDAAEALRDDDGEAFRSARSQVVSQVYTLRIPADRLDQLRQVAHGRQMSTAALMRQWVIERLDSEDGTLDKRLTEHVRGLVRDELRAAGLKTAA